MHLPLSLSLSVSMYIDIYLSPPPPVNSIYLSTSASPSATQRTAQPRSSVADRAADF